VPSNYARYHIEALKHALDDAYGVMPHITCDAQGELAEVRPGSLECMYQQRGAVFVGLLFCASKQHVITDT
jgi:hypothetical protein